MEGSCPAPKMELGGIRLRPEVAIVIPGPIWRGPTLAPGHGLLRTHQGPRLKLVMSGAFACSEGMEAQNLGTTEAWELNLLL